MPDIVADLLDPTRLLFDLQRSNEIAQSFAGCLLPDDIAHFVTNGLVEKFDIAFARIWLMEPEQTTLRLVASSGLYTHINGSFARVPMGAYKVGKIAQNRVSFLSNHLADEAWVKDRQWAIANNIRGFAGYPLTVRDRVVGVLATFSHRAMATEFLEVLQMLCTTVSVSLDAALQYQQQMKTSAPVRPNLADVSLSDQLATLLKSTRLTLIGTEQPLAAPLTYVFLQSAQILNQLGCTYCRLLYSAKAVTLEAIVPVTDSNLDPQLTQAALTNLRLMATYAGGSLHQIGANQKALQLSLQVPYPSDADKNAIAQRLTIQCHQPILQAVFTHLALLAGLTLCDVPHPTIALLTDDLTQVEPGRSVLWIRQTNPVPKGVMGCINLSTTPAEFLEAVTAVNQGRTWNIENASQSACLSERELDVMNLLAEGLRDRDIATRLHISESTVKFHMNNVLTKLKAKTRYQALHQAIVRGWIQ
ncbi:GAF domain-containing protein [Phormidium sp. CLA17]|uniref:LuxR C-terminal-related transcriptional regulator n=1 Tax=Leptolyngbya sp. Cla-17 TaxID=2803751 RepID=UPI00149297A7|nr:LuxR C-terminal-related transcriptional regulator [Leptolyngbya sp. Cla-17]MBM0741517.1 GAF domain-containing protein [Leptolyngbya sp. Cla-17]